jgi:hypothetical protein
VHRRMGFNSFCMLWFGFCLNFVVQRMGFKSLVLGCVSICMGFKGSHLKTHVYSIKVMTATLKTYANSSNYCFTGTLLVLASPLLVLASPC